MEKINVVRALIGGILASIVFIVAELIVEGIVRLITGFSEADMARQYFPDIILSGTRYQIVNLIYLIVSCTFTIWLYAALRPKFGKGIKTAFIASMLFIIVIFLFMVNQLNMGIYPLKLALISLAYSLAEFPVSIVAGASVYDSRTVEV